MESEVSDFWSKYGEIEEGTSASLVRPPPSPNLTFEGLRSARKHVDRMRAYAFGNSGGVFAKEAAELLIALGVSESKSERYLAKNLTTAMLESNEFVREPNCSFVHVDFLASRTEGIEERVAASDSSLMHTADMDKPADSDAGSETAQVVGC